MITLIFAQTPIGDPSKYAGLATPVAIAMIAGIVLIILGVAFLKITGDRERKFFELITAVLKAQTQISNSLNDVSQAMMDLSGNLQDNNDRLDRLEDLGRRLEKHVFRNDTEKRQDDGGNKKFKL